MCSFLKTIWFCVSVPVLSERRYDTLPSSSGMVVDLATVPGVALSFCRSLMGKIRYIRSFDLNHEP